MGTCDRSSKFLLERYGDGLLHLLGFPQVREWRTMQPETIAVGQTPDGVLEARFPDREEWVRFLIEFATYPNAREYEQVFRGTMLMQAAKGETPEAVVVVLRPKSNLQLPSNLTRPSLLGTAAVTVQWRVVELWRIPAATLLDARDPGLIPWVPLTDFEGEPEALLNVCRERVEELAPPERHEELLAATRILAGLRFGSKEVLDLLIRRRTMLDLPELREIEEEALERGFAKGKAEGIAYGELLSELRLRRQATIDLLEVRFGVVPDATRWAIEAVQSRELLTRLYDAARMSAALSDFEDLLNRE